MFDLSMAEMFLWAWAVAGTSFALKFRGERNAAANALFTMLDDEKKRNEAVAHYKLFKARFYGDL